MTYADAVAAWSADMLAHGRTHGEALIAQAALLDAGQPADSGGTYYDAARVFYQIADFVAGVTQAAKPGMPPAPPDPFWATAANAAARLYRDVYVVPNAGRVTGYDLFTRGLLEDYRRTGDEASRAAVLLLAENAAYAPDTVPSAWTTTWEVSREVAYNLLAQVDAEALGAPARARADLLAGQALGHLRQWTAGPRVARYVRSFMVGLTCEALIARHAVTGDVRVLPAIKAALDWLWEHNWDEAARAFKYQDVEDPADPADSDAGTGPAPHLNLLIAPAFGWVWRQTGDATYRDRGDEVFIGGVAGSWLTGIKQFNQNYRWSFDYARDRETVPPPELPRSFVITPRRLAPFRVDVAGDGGVRAFEVKA